MLIDMAIGRVAQPGYKYEASKSTVPSTPTSWCTIGIITEKRVLSPLTPSPFIAFSLCREYGGRILSHYHREK